MKQVPETWKAVLKKPVFIHFTTLMPDGSPQTSPVWVDIDGDAVLVNTARGRVKDENVRRDPRVSFSVTDPDNPYKNLTVRGKVTKIVEEGADAHIDFLAKKYLGKDKYPFRQPNEKRVIYRIEPSAVAAG
jgi:PPOX class probable F420-dependent enzyme